MNAEGVILRVLNIGTIDNSPSGRLIFTVFSAFAEFERDLIVSRTQEGKAWAKANNPNFHDGMSRKVDDHRRGTYLSRKYGMGRRGIQYLVDLIQKHGEDILDRPQQKYTVDFKLAAIERVLLRGEALRQVSLDLGLTNTGILAN